MHTQRLRSARWVVPAKSPWMFDSFHWTGRRKDENIMSGFQHNLSYRLREVFFLHYIWTNFPSYAGTIVKNFRCRIRDVLLRIPLRFLGDLKQRIPLRSSVFIMRVFRIVVTKLLGGRLILRTISWFM